MIDGNPHEFIDKMYTGQDIVFLFDGIKYWFQGYCNADGVCHMEIEQYEPPADIVLWEKNAATMTDCLIAFQDAPIFNGHTFWEVEHEITWVDD